MKPVWTSAAAVVLLVVAAVPGGGQPPGQDPTKEGDYFPLHPGAIWTYEAGGSLITVKLTKQEEKKVGDAMIKHSRLETTINNMPFSSEVVAVLPQGLCRVAVADKPVTPPLCFLELPLKKGKKWKVESKVGNETITGEFEAHEEEVAAKEINSPYFAGKEEKKVKLLVVRGINLKANKQEMSLTYYFAPDVGIVKQMMSFGGVQVDLRLKSYDFNK
ncbi:MAG: hypothetical protein HYS12_10910 [Planctomycetes bacterium]|nr:hypothetical protein [Planctomycetota bacterium]